MQVSYMDKNVTPIPDRVYKALRAKSPVKNTQKTGGQLGGVSKTAIFAGESRLEIATLDCNKKGACLRDNSFLTKLRRGLGNEGLKTATTLLYCRLAVCIEQLNFPEQYSVFGMGPWSQGYPGNGLTLSIWLLVAKGVVLQNRCSNDGVTK